MEHKFKRGDRCIIARGDLSETFHGYIFRVQKDEVSQNGKIVSKLENIKDPVPSEDLEFVISKENEPEWDIMKMKKGDIVFYDIFLARAHKRMRGVVLSPSSPVSVLVHSYVVGERMRVNVHYDQIRFHACRE